MNTMSLPPYLYIDLHPLPDQGEGIFLYFNVWSVAENSFALEDKLSFSNIRRHSEKVND